jgi:hypothetical protein
MVVSGGNFRNCSVGIARIFEDIVGYLRESINDCAEKEFAACTA